MAVDQLDLRPTGWDTYIGQEAMKERLQIHIEAAKRDFRLLDHVLLTGPPGTGKSSIARVIANEMGEDFLSVVCPIKPAKLRKIVLAFGGVLLMDELHRQPKKDQEELLTLLEDGYLSLPNGGKLKMNYGFTIIAATTEPDKIVAPVHDRFPIKPMFVDYTDDEMRQIVMGMAARSGVELSEDTARKLGRATGGIPRAAQALIGMARDLQTNDVDTILSKCEITEDGLTKQHQAYVKIIVEAGGVCGLSLLKSHLQLPVSVLGNLEKLLFKRGYIDYTPRGRELTADGWKRAMENEDLVAGLEF